MQPRRSCECWFLSLVNEPRYLKLSQLSVEYAAHAAKKLNRTQEPSLPSNISIHPCHGEKQLWSVIKAYQKNYPGQGSDRHVDNSRTQLNTLKIGIHFMRTLMATNCDVKSYGISANDLQMLNTVKFKQIIPRAFVTSEFALRSCEV